MGAGQRAAVESVAQRVFLSASELMKWLGVVQSVLNPGSRPVPAELLVLRYPWSQVLIPGPVQQTVVLSASCAIEPIQSGLRE